MSLLLDVRLADRRDLDACAALACEAHARRSIDDWRAAFATDLESPDHLLVVAVGSVGVLGYGRARLFDPGNNAAADSAPAGYYLSGVYVVPRFRRNRIGSTLIEARLEWVSQRASDAWYFANARNTGSIALHRRLGFEEVTRNFSFPGVTFEGGEGILFRARLSRTRAE